METLTVDLFDSKDWGIKKTTSEKMANIPKYSSVLSSGIQ